MLASLNQSAMTTTMMMMMTFAMSCSTSLTAAVADESRGGVVGRR